jgi:hypothetical protein
LLLTVVVIVAVGIGVAVILVVAVVVGVVIVAVIVCADADFVANPSKEMLAALTAVALSSCLRVRTRCNFFMGRSLGKYLRMALGPEPLAQSQRLRRIKVSRGFEIAEKLVSLSIYEAV